MPNEWYIRFNSTYWCPSFNTKCDGLSEILLESYEGNSSAAGMLWLPPLRLAFADIPLALNSAIRNSSNNEPYQPHCGNVPWVKKKKIKPSIMGPPKRICCWKLTHNWRFTLTVTFLWLPTYTSKGNIVGKVSKRETRPSAFPPGNLHITEYMSIDIPVPCPMFTEYPLGGRTVLQHSKPLIGVGWILSCTHIQK